MSPRSNLVIHAHRGSSEKYLSLTDVTTSYTELLCVRSNCQNYGIKNRLTLHCECLCIVSYWPIQNNCERECMSQLCNVPT
jgi:hypothetical protein